MFTTAVDHGSYPLGALGLKSTKSGPFIQQDGFAS